jgi:transketolase
MADLEKCKRIVSRTLKIRKEVLTLALNHKIHIGGDFSAAELMTTIWMYMNYNPVEPKWEDRDRFVLSKGHAAAVTSLNQEAIGCYPKGTVIAEYNTDNGRFGMHSCNLLNPHVEVSTGSLGHGLPVTVGIAQALKQRGNHTSRVYTVMGDGEQEEGSIWEAVMYAKHLGLNNLICFVDNNGLQFTSSLKDKIGIEPLEDKYRTFGWNVVSMSDGNDVVELADFFDNLKPHELAVPTVVIAHTVKGKGVSFMENQLSWHNGIVTQEQFDKAVAELEAAYEEKWGDK